MKSRGGLGREVHLSSSLAFIFSRSFLLRTAPHYLNAWNRLRRLTIIECFAQNHVSVFIINKVDFQMQSLRLCLIATNFAVT